MSAQDLRRAAEAEAAALPPLLVAAEHLAQAVQMGGHGRRRAGAGAEFWQYRPAVAGDEARLIDWRRSARSDQDVVRAREWEAPASVWLWADPSASLRFSGAPSRPEKAARAQLLALALGVLMLKAGERVGVIASEPLTPRAGRAAAAPLALKLMERVEAESAPLPQVPLGAGARVVLISDFLSDPEALSAQIGAMAAQGQRGVLLQVLDPDEEAFPFKGRTLFESMGGATRYEAQDAGALRARYLERLALRRGRLSALAQGAGWQFGTHTTGHPALGGLMWLAQALEV